MKTDKHLEAFIMSEFCLKMAQDAYKRDKEISSEYTFWIESRDYWHGLWEKQHNNLRKKTHQYQALAGLIFDRPTKGAQTWKHVPTIVSRYYQFLEKQKLHPLGDLDISKAQKELHIYRECKTVMDVKKEISRLSSSVPYYLDPSGDIARTFTMCYWMLNDVLKDE
jgi:hypothetical protein